jgi:hypothetical protein
LLASAPSLRCSATAGWALAAGGLSMRIGVMRRLGAAAGALGTVLSHVCSTTVLAAGACGGAGGLQ